MPDNEVTLAQFERLIERMWKAYERFERVVVYKDGFSHEIVKGQEEYDKYQWIKNMVEAHAGKFSWMKMSYPD